jgi:hypothetical protein
VAARQAGYRSGEARALDALGHAGQRNGRPGPVRQYWQDALVILEELGDPLLDTVATQLRTL